MSNFYPILNQGMIKGSRFIILKFLFHFYVNHLEFTIISHYVKYVFMEKHITFPYVKHVWKKPQLTNRVRYRARFSVWGTSNTFITSPEAELVFPQWQRFLERLGLVSALLHFSWEEIGERSWHEKPI